MRVDLQRDFIHRVSQASHSTLVEELETSLGLPIEFRVCEAPIFLSQEFAHDIQRAAVEIIEECVLPANLQRSDATLQPRYTVRNESRNPLFSVVDFAVTIDADGAFQPRLIELQGFPSLFGYQWALMNQFITTYGLEGGTPYLSGFTEDQYRATLAEAVYATCDPAEVALVEIDPAAQKTRPDFLAMQRLIGLQTVNIRDVRRFGKGLAFRDEDGTMRPLRRIFNRAIIDELDDLGVSVDFAWNDELDVEWAGHPNWYFRISKFLLPYLKHPTVPRSTLVSAVDLVEPEMLSNVVLKPLYAFAGKGVNVAPTLDDVRAIPTLERSGWILQEKVQYAPCVPTPHGNNFVEVRIMLVWPETERRPIPVMTLARTGRGALMGARYNTIPWTGSSGCLIA